MCCNEKEDVIFPRNFPIQPINPDKPIKGGTCPICRGDRVVKIIENGIEHYAACVCNEHRNDIQKCIDIVERIKKMQKENKGSDDNKPKTEEIQWQAFQPEHPIKEGQCPICRGEGFLRAMVNGHEYTKRCDCMEKQIAMEQLQKTGIAESIEKYTFDSFRTPEKWQEALKQSALHFLDEREKWFFVGGQVGCGKTHICTAIVGEFFKRGKSVKYMLWTNEIVKMKANKMDAENYQKLIEPFLRTEVLYIDDFFKTEKGKRPSEADIKTAFEIINYRYVNSKLITIISCEKEIGDLLEIDEAVGSRIYQRTKEYGIIVTWGRDRNWRMKE